MQFLLAAVNARYIHSNPAIFSLRAYAGEKLRPFIALAEYTINNRMEEILGDIYRRRPDVIGFSCYIWNFRLVGELIREIPKVLPDTDIWLGGPEVSFGAEEILAAFPMVRGIMVGEGEETFKDLLSYYIGREDPQAVGGEHDLKRIPGLALREGLTPARELMDLKKLPFLYEDLGGFENRIIYYETGRGCPYRCGYCLSAIDKSVRFRSLETVKRELQYFLDKKVPQVKLVDRTFNCNRARAIEIWSYLKDNDNGVTNFHFEIAADLLDEGELALLKEMRPGQVQLEIGVQTTNKDTLKAICREADTAHIAKVVGSIREGGNIHIHLDLIAGLPFEGYASFGRSFNEVYAMKPHQLQLGFLKVLKGTPIWEKSKDYGIVCQDGPPYEVLCTKWISYGEILELKEIEEMVELYYNSGQFTHTLPVLEKEFAGPFEMFGQMAAFYREKGYFTNSPARSHRYQVLLEFIQGKTAPDTELYRELLTFDYYLRENAKSRPAFGADLSPYRDEIWDFYRREEERPEILQGYKGCHARQAMKMTHMEVFRYPVWETGKEFAGGGCLFKAKRMKEPYFVLFDYKKRDAVTGEACTHVLEI